ncbi:hypothetical protein CC99x_001260 [Candidatus Berkiella cookevillensis]|uniref:Outer membrane protein beta-barrel domain-containing protein n=1 Tax=Candidatus Berkiella cookevillensis TaxID=437022 RepID=A0A0Q9YU35_9GAMM|nr:hypothetical protein [Candidatus Berkiella cookevillensis]MCS5707525.1 hypothetical protein [Candidatus Berkiella cookevillensis]
MKTFLKFIACGTAMCFSAMGNTASEFGIYAELNKADIRGFQQTPKGGHLETTSLKRPSFEELNIDSKVYTSIGAWLRFDPFQINFNYLPLRYDGQTILSSELITHGITIPQGSYFSSDIEDQLYSVDFARIFKPFNTFTIAPMATMHALDHHYEFNSGPLSSKRSFFATGFGLGLDMTYAFLYQYELNAKIHVPIPVTNLDVSKAKLSLAYVWVLTPHLTMKPYALVEWNKIKFKDHQQVPNYLEYRLSPIWGMGISMMMHN